MNYKYILVSILIAAFGVVGMYFLLNQTTLSSSAEFVASDGTEPVSSIIDTIKFLAEATSSHSTPALPIPELVTPNLPQTTVYTIAQVQLHSDEASCWTAINGKVYDLTAFITQHPGGDRNILRICGLDGTRAFMGQHGGQADPKRTLAGFYIGNVK